MSESIDQITQKLLDDIAQRDLTTDEASKAVNNLKTYGEAVKLLAPEPTPVPEPTGLKGFFATHSGDLIKVGGTISAISLIALFETRGDLIFRSKAAKYI